MTPAERCQWFYEDAIQVYERAREIWPGQLKDAKVLRVSRAFADYAERAGSMDLTHSPL